MSFYWKVVILSALSYWKVVFEVRLCCIGRLGPLLKSPWKTIRKKYFWSTAQDRLGKPTSFKNRPRPFAVWRRGKQQILRKPSVFQHSEPAKHYTKVKYLFVAIPEWRDRSFELFGVTKKNEADSKGLFRVSLEGVSKRFRIGKTRRAAAKHYTERYVLRRSSAILPIIKRFGTPSFFVLRPF